MAETDRWRASGEVVAIRRIPGAAYGSSMETAPLEDVVGIERRFPAEWTTAARNDVTAVFVEWARPLVGDVPPHVRL